MPNSKRKNRDPLSAQLIVQTALELIEQEGLEALSMRTLAKTLRVDPMAIYHHVPNKANLLSSVYESVLAEFLLPGNIETTWQETLKNLARRFRNLAARYPKLFPGLIASSHDTKGLSKAIVTILSVLLEAGLNPTVAVRASDTLFAFVSGFVLLELNSPQDPVPELLVEAIGMDSANSKALLESLQANQFSDSFEFGLQMIIAGIQTNLDKYLT